MGEENVEAVMPLHVAPFWWWRAAWRGAGHVSSLPGAGRFLGGEACVAVLDEAMMLREGLG